MFWYEVFDDERVQLRVRRRAARHVATLLAALAGLLCGAIVLGEVWNSWMVAGTLAALLALVAAGASAASLARLRDIVWCIKLSADEVVGYDHTRRRIAMNWSDVESIDVTAKALHIVGRPEGPRTPSLSVPSRFAAFAALSHRVTRYAEAHGVPVCVEGRPWQLLDVEALFPFLREAPMAAEAQQSDEREGFSH